MNSKAILEATKEASDILEEEVEQGLTEIRSLSAKVELTQRWIAASDLWAYQRPFKSGKP